jgi:phosphatidylserine/phosphatidylglycerophosphate/cardiolipin synthase-like enzyme
MGTDVSEMQVLIGPEFAKGIIPLIEEAKNEILISVFLWNFYYQEPSCEIQQVNQALIRAKNRGVKIKALVSNESKLKKLIECGLEIKESTFANKLHNKVIIIDQKHCVLGSHNLTKNALGRNYEISVVFPIAGNEDRLYKFVKSMVEWNG